jgi:molybdate transport system regulatory protein
VLILFKETEVSIARSLSGDISCRNRLRSVIRAIERSEILSKLTLDFDGLNIVSVITTRSVDALGLEVGDTVEGIVKSNEITIKKADARVHA